MIRRIVLSEIFKIAANGFRMAQKQCAGILPIARQPEFPGKIDQVDRPLGRRIGMPGPARGLSAETGCPDLPQSSDPVAVDGIAGDRHPGEAMCRQQGFQIVI